MAKKKKGTAIQRFVASRTSTKKASGTKAKGAPVTPAKMKGKHTSKTQAAAVKKASAKPAAGKKVKTKPIKNKKHPLAGKSKSAAHKAAIAASLRAYHANKKKGKNTKKLATAALKGKKAPVKTVKSKTPKVPSKAKTKAKAPVAKSTKKPAAKKAATKPTTVMHPTKGKLKLVKTSAGRSIYVDKYGKETRKPRAKKSK
ncbi:hypothetical protein [Rhizobium phage RHEph12]|nr:hypothetical protein [Rhizobium phage RHEph12]